MTLSTLISQIAYAGDDSTTSFDTTFQFWDNDELDVFIRTISTGVEVIQVLGVDYTVLGGAGILGSVEMTIAPTLTPAEELHIRRKSDEDQEKDLSPSTVLPTAAIEEALDRQAMRGQEDRTDLTQRGMLIPVTDIPPGGVGPDMDLPSTVLRSVDGVGGGFLAFDTAGLPIIATSTLPTASTTAFIDTLLDDIDAATARATLETIFNRTSVVDAIDAGTAATRAGIAAATFGTGYFIETDTQRTWYSDASTWKEIGIGQYAAASLPATSAPVGNMYLDTDKNQFVRDDGSALVYVAAPLPRGHIVGTEMTLSGTTDISFSAGEVRGGTSGTRSFINGVNTAAIIKELDTAAGWVAGTTAAGRPTADVLGANKWHHCFELIHPTTGAVDFGFDDVIEATNLLADAAVVTAGYTQYRYLGSQQETAAGTGVIREQHQEGDDFWMDTVDLLAFATTALDATTQVDFLLVGVPPGLRIKANVIVSLDESTLTGGSFYTASNGGATITGSPAEIASPLALFQHNTSPVLKDISQQLTLWTDVTQQITFKAVGDTSISVSCQVMSYVNHRGRNF